MSFELAEQQMRERFVESFALLNHIRQTSPTDFRPLNNIEKSIRGLWLVSLYAAFEWGANIVVQASFSEISNHGTSSIDFLPSVHGLIHHSHIRSIKDCNPANVFDKSASLFEAALSSTPVQAIQNPLIDRLTNVDGKTLMWLTRLFGMDEMFISPSDLGRLKSLRERRNSVAHGRESTIAVGERFTNDEMLKMYTVADNVCITFLMKMKHHCLEKQYLRTAA